jgi:hypothetical protein
MFGATSLYGYTTKRDLVPPSSVRRSLTERPSYVTRWRRTGWLGRRDSNLCISKSDLLNFIPPQRDLGVDRARL